MRFLIASVLLVAPAFAQEPGASPADAVRGSMGIDLPSAYFFRGIIRENQGVIAQPWFELTYRLSEGGPEFGPLDLTFGLWNSLHDGPTGGSGGIWYESDFHFGLGSKIGERLSVAATYRAMTSPNGSFGNVGTVEELAFSCSYDDRGRLLDLFESGLQPSVVLAFELDGQADRVPTGNLAVNVAGNLGIYAQVGVEPSFALGRLGELDVRLAVPLTMGLSLRNYYEDVNGRDDFFGFLDLGAVASSPLPFLPSRLGPWHAEFGLHWLLLGDSNEQRNAGDTSALIVSLGLSTTF